MKEFWDKYFLEVVIGITFFIAASIYKTIQWFLKIKIFKPVDELNKSLLQFQKINEAFALNLREYADNLKKNESNIKTTELVVNNLTKEVHENIERVVTSVGNLSVQLEDVKENLQRQIEKLRDELVDQGKELNELKGEHKSFHSKHINNS